MVNFVSTSIINCIIKLIIDFAVVGSTRKNKKSILFDKTFLIDIVDTTVNSKVEKLITSYGGVSF